MTEERIKDMVDRRIKTSFNEGTDIYQVSLDLATRIRNFTNVIKKGGSSVDKLRPLKFDEINNIRQKYGITYLKQCEKRVDDLDWLIVNRSKFSNLSDVKLFDLIILKDKFIK